MVLPYHPGQVVALLRDLATFATRGVPRRDRMPEAPGDQVRHIAYEVSETVQDYGVEIGDLIVYRPEKAESPLVLQRALPLTALAKLVDAGAVTLLEVIPCGASAASAGPAPRGARSPRRVGRHLALVRTERARDVRPAKSS